MSVTKLALLQTYRQRRERIMQWLHATGGEVAIAPAASEATRNRDSGYPYRYDSCFYYLTGFTESKAVLAIVISTGNVPARSALSCRPKYEEYETWDGFCFGPEAAKDAFGLNEAHSAEGIDATLSKLLANTTVVAYSLVESNASGRCMCRWLDTVRVQDHAGASSPYRVLDVRIILDEIRLFKDASESDTIHRAGRAFVGAYVCAIQALCAGLRECHLEAELLYEFRRHSV